MITIDWTLFVLMLAGTASLTASLSTFLACWLMRHKRHRRAMKTAYMSITKAKRGIADEMLCRPLPMGTI